MRWILLVVLAGCSSSSKPVDAAITPQMCEDTFEAAIVRDCVAPADCVELIHPDCCGDVEIAVAASDQAAAQTAEGTYQTCENGSCGARGCQHALQAEDGMVPMTGQSIQMACVSGKCTTVVR
jgi:hypothetical protein